MDRSSTAEILARLEKLRGDFIAKLPQKREELNVIWASLSQSGFLLEECARLQNFVHKIRPTLVMHGFADIAEFAALIEERIDSEIELGSEAFTQKNLEDVSLACRKLGDALSKIG